MRSILCNSGQGWWKKNTCNYCMLRKGGKFKSLVQSPKIPGFENNLTVLKVSTHAVKLKSSVFAKPNKHSCGKCHGEWCSKLIVH